MLLLVFHYQARCRQYCSLLWIGKRLCVFATDQKRWLKDLRESHPKFKRSRPAQEFRDDFGGDILSRSTVSDWLKRDAVQMPRRCRERAVLCLIPSYQRCKGTNTAFRCFTSTCLCVYFVRQLSVLILWPRLAGQLVWNPTSRKHPGYPAVRFFSKLNNLFFGYFDPINIFFDNKNK